MCGLSAHVLVRLMLWSICNALCAYLVRRMPFVLQPCVRLSAETKNQWARDDPAFMVVLVAFLAVACIAYGLAFGIKSVFAYIWLVLFTITVDWLLPGIVIASVACWIAN